MPSDTQMQSLRGHIRAHPVVSFGVLAIGLGVGPLAVVAAGVVPTGFSQMGALSASVAGFILAAMEGGPARIGELLRRGSIWRVGAKWWISALLYTAPVAVLAILVASQLSQQAVDWGGLEPLSSIVPMMVILVVLAGLGEEFGWRGYLLPRLQARHNALVSSLIVGGLHSLWHIPLFLVDGTAQSAWAQEVGLPFAIVGYSLFVTAWAIQLTWFFNNTKGSVLLVAVVHGAGNAWIGGYLDVSGSAGVGGNAALTVLMLLLSGGLLVVTGPEHLSRGSVREQVST